MYLQSKTNLLAVLNWVTKSNKCGYLNMCLTSKSIEGVVLTTVRNSILIVLRNLEKDLLKTQASALLK